MNINPLDLVLLSAALYNRFVGASKKATPLQYLYPLIQGPPANVTVILNTFPLERGEAVPVKLHSPVELPNRT
jgi:hypothetical protein